MTLTQFPTHVDFTLLDMTLLAEYWALSSVQCHLAPAGEQEGCDSLWAVNYL